MLDCDPALRIEEVMEPGPSTVRPDKPVDELIERLDRQQLRFAIVTTPEGRLLVSSDGTTSSIAEGRGPRSRLQLVAVCTLVTSP